MTTIIEGLIAPLAGFPPLKPRADGIRFGRLRLPSQIPSTSFPTRLAHIDWTYFGGHVSNIAMPASIGLLVHADRPNIGEIQLGAGLFHMVAQKLSGDIRN